MIYEDLGGVILDICNEYPNRELAAGTRYTVEQIIEKVVFREESVTYPGNHRPSYLWAEVIDDGEPYLDIDCGHLPYMVRAWDYHKGVYNDGSYRINPPAYELAEIGLDAFIGGATGPLEPTLTWMLEHGISVGQRVLFRVHYNGGYDSFTGEGYSELEVYLIYVKPLEGPVRIFPDRKDEDDLLVNPGAEDT